MVRIRRPTSNGKSLFIKKIVQYEEVLRQERMLSIPFLCCPLFLCFIHSWLVIGKEKGLEEAILCLTIEMRSGKLF